MNKIKRAIHVFFFGKCKAYHITPDCGGVSYSIYCNRNRWHFGMHRTKKTSMEFGSQECYYRKGSHA